LILKKALKKCIDLIQVDPSLSKTSAPNVIKLKFDKIFSDLFSVVPRISNISINGLNSSDFNYTISKSDSEQQFIITISFSKQMIKYSALTLFLSPPYDIEYHPSHRLMKRQVSIMLNSYFSVSNDTQSDVDSAKLGTKTGSILVSAGAIMMSFTKPGWVFAFRSLLLMDLIRSLKFD
jgi:hypothetical protein